MKIAVLLRRVPDTTTKIVIAADGKSINESGVKFVPNPYDEYAIEAAIALKEAAGAGETVVYALGGDNVQETLRTALATGIDRAVHLRRCCIRRRTRQRTSALVEHLKPGSVRRDSGGQAGGG